MAARFIDGGTARSFYKESHFATAATVNSTASIQALKHYSNWPASRAFAWRSKIGHLAYCFKCMEANAGAAPGPGDGLAAAATVAAIDAAIAAAIVAATTTFVINLQ